MNRQIAKLSLALAFVIAIALGFTACDFRFWKPDDQPKELKPHYQYVWFIDQSSSVDPSGQTQWQKAAEEQVKCLRCGDALFAFGLHNQTPNAAPIYDAEIPAVSDDPTSIDDEKCHRKLIQVRRELKKKLREAFDPQHRAPKTDYFSAIDRIKPDRTHQTMVFFVGDMLQSNRELDLERVRLTDENIVDLLNPIVARHGWQRDRLKGVKVHCLLNSLNIRDAAPLNDRRILRKFWETLFQSLGAAGTMQSCCRPIIESEVHRCRGSREVRCNGPQENVGAMAVVSVGGNHYSGTALDACDAGKISHNHVARHQGCH